MKPIKLVTLAAVAAFATFSAQATHTVLDLDVSATLEGEYSSATPASGDPYGFLNFAYTFATAYISSDFDLYETYHWTIEGGAKGGYTYTETGGTPESDKGSGSFSPVEIDGSVNDLTQLLFGATPEQVYGFLTSLPGSGTLEDLIDAVSLGLGIPLNNDPFSEISSSSISYTSDFSLPSGYINVDINAPIDGYSYADIKGTGYLKIKAVHIPDTGSTALLAFAGLGILFAAKRRIHTQSPA